MNGRSNKTSGRVPSAPRYTAAILLCLLMLLPVFFATAVAQPEGPTYAATPVCHCNGNPSMPSLLPMDDSSAQAAQPLPDDMTAASDEAADAAFKDASGLCRFSAWSDLIHLSRIPSFRCVYLPKNSIGSSD